MIEWIYLKLYICIIRFRIFLKKGRMNALMAEKERLRKLLDD